ncbi:hypothetical protein WN990_30975 [Kitasatospora purpeofusca]|uniref:hypothetical protein n=1 Tax=Kitasatospora purpeofusca TaxID=67352 RepID=UPI0030F32A3C
MRLSGYRPEPLLAPSPTALPSPDPALREVLEGLPGEVGEVCGPFALLTGDIAHPLQELATH